MFQFVCSLVTGSAIKTPSNLLCYDSMHDKTCIMHHLLLSHAQSVNLDMLDVSVFISSFVKPFKNGVFERIYHTYNRLHACL